MSIRIPQNVDLSLQNCLRDIEEALNDTNAELERVSPSNANVDIRKLADDVEELQRRLSAPAPTETELGHTMIKGPLTVDGLVTIIGTGGVGTIVGYTEAHGGVLVNPNGITATINVIAWQAPYACTVVAVRGYRVGGTSASINARLNGTNNHLSSALSLTSADTWIDGGAVQNTAYAAGDKLEIMLTAVGGSPTQIGVQVVFVRAA